MDDERRSKLAAVSREAGTPCYVYFLDGVLARFAALQRAFGARFGVSFAVKSNPNRVLLERIRDRVVTLDVSSAGELERALRAGYDPARLTFSGPAKRHAELERAVELGVGEMVCESEGELAALDELAGRAEKRMPVFLRINPDRIPRKFGVNMAARASQFGIDEDQVDAVLKRLPKRRHLEFAGFHIYSGTNCLDAEALAENFGIFIELFTRFANRHGLRPRKLIFGSGFGIPYHDGDEPFDLEKVAELVNPQIDAIRQEAALSEAECVLEMGRWLVGPEGYFLTRVVAEKHSRGTDIRLCDGGMNHHLAACGLLGQVIRRPYPMHKVTGDGAGEPREYMLVGPLCTTIDTLAPKIRLPELHTDDVIAIGSSGAYGLSSSPVGFISHPPPRELLVIGTGASAEVLDVTETHGA